MTENEIKEFLDGAPKYIETLKKCSHETCFVCGMRADSFEKIVEAIKANQQVK